MNDFCVSYNQMTVAAILNWVESKLISCRHTCKYYFELKIHLMLDSLMQQSDLCKSVKSQQKICMSARGRCLPPWMDYSRLVEEHI